MSKTQTYRAGHSFALPIVAVGMLMSVLGLLLLPISWIIGGIILAIGGTRLPVRI